MRRQAVKVELKDDGTIDVETVFLLFVPVLRK